LEYTESSKRDQVLLPPAPHGPALGDFPHPALQTTSYTSGINPRVTFHYLGSGEGKAPEELREFLPVETLPLTPPVEPLELLPLSHIEQRANEVTKKVSCGLTPGKIGIVKKIGSSANFFRQVRAGA
jgi:hypothetical protein